MNSRLLALSAATLMSLSTVASAADREVPYNDLTGCIIASQIAPNGTTYATNRVCAPLGEEVNLFPSRMMGQRPLNGNYGTTALIQAKIRMNTLLSTFNLGDGRDAHIFVEEKGPVKETKAIDLSVRLEAHKFVSLPLPSGFKLILSMDDSNALTTFEGALAQNIAAPTQPSPGVQKKQGRHPHHTPHTHRPVAVQTQHSVDTSYANDEQDQANLSVAQLNRASTNAAYVFNKPTNVLRK